MRLIILLFMIASAACGTPKDEPTNIASADAAGEMSVEVDMAPAVMCPTEGQLFCGEKCIDVTFDLDHCGTCGNACTRGKMTCMMGECLCLGDGVMCEGECYDTFTSRDHCGECGNACTSVEACVEGGCIPINEDPHVLGVLVATNEARAAQQDCGEHGLKPAVGPVMLHEQLTLAAQGHAEDMAANRFLEHEGSDGSSPGERAARAGWSGGVGENVAEGYDTANQAVAGWVDSDGHCNNLMNGSFNRMGVGYAVSEITGQPYWAQLFGSD